MLYTYMKVHVTKYICEKMTMCFREWTVIRYHIHQDTKLALLIAVCKRSLTFCACLFSLSAVKIESRFRLIVCVSVYEINRIIHDTWICGIYLLVFNLICCPIEHSKINSISLQVLCIILKCNFCIYVYSLFLSAHLYTITFIDGMPVCDLGPGMASWPNAVNGS